MRLHLFLFAFLFTLVMTSISRAHTEVEESFTCPIDGNTWKQKMDMSGTVFGRRLDLKQLGPTAAPWRIPHCPKCRFVVLGKEGGEAPSAALKAYILSESYRTASKDQPSYLCLALIQTFQKAAPQAIGHSYLRASWQTEANPEECRKHLESSLAQFKTAFADLKADSPDFVTVSILTGELQRRTGRFDEARQHCEVLVEHEAIKKADLQDVVKRELQFIAKKDSAPHAMTAEQESLLTPWK